MLPNFRHNREAFAAFIKAHQDMVYSIVLGMLQQPEDAEEITQDVFVEVYHKAEGFRGEAAVTTWLYRIATNKCYDHLRHQQRKKRFARVISLFKPESGEPAADAGDFVHPGVLAENREKAGVLFRALAQLPPNQKTAYLLTETEHLTYKEVAEVMGVTVASVEALLHRAKQNLRKLLADFYKTHIQS